jgi:pimeloyl-ACP methyl ester carboxylesterase
VRNYFSIRNDPALQGHFALRELCKSVEAPTLITRGDSRVDKTHPLPHAFELAYSLKNSHLWIKPEGGCFATAEGYAKIRELAAEAAKQPVSA